MGQVITVTTSQELAGAVNALSDTQDGGTILVENSSEIYTLSRFQVGSETGHITVKAADPGDPPTFGQVKLINSQNMSFEDLHFDSRSLDSVTKDIELLKSSNISFENNTLVNASNGFFNGLDSSVVRGTNAALVRDSDDINFSGNDFSQYNQGVAVIDSVGTEIVNNTFSKMSGDGVRLAGVQDTLVEGNVFQSFYGTTQNINHSDMLQVWSAPYNTLNTEDLTIRSNFFNSSDGVATQTIFIKNETIDDTGRHYENITIEDNLIYNGHLHGVSVHGATNVIVHDNTMVWNSDATIQSTPTSTPVSGAPGIRFREVPNGSVDGNIASTYIVPSEMLGDNATVEFTNTAAPNFVSNHFVNGLNAGVIDLRDLQLLESSPWVSQYGISNPDFLLPAEEITPVLRQTLEVSNFGEVVYDAGETGGLSAGEIANSTFLWQFADGTIMEGEQVKYTYTDPGTFDVTLLVTAPDGTQLTVERTTEIQPEVLLDLDFNSGLTDDSIFDVPMVDRGNGFQSSGGETGGGYKLTGSSDLVFERLTPHLQNLESFTIDVTIRQDVGGDSGTFLHMHSGFRAEVTDTGSVRFGLGTSDGSFVAQTVPGKIIPGQWHDITVTFSEAAGGLRVFVDGDLSAQVPATGTMVANGSGFSLVVGDTWGDSLQGTVDNLMVTKSVNVPGGEQAGPSLGRVVDPDTLDAETLALLEADKGDALVPTVTSQSAAPVASQQDQQAEEDQQQAEEEARLAEEARQQAEEERRAEEEQQQAEEEERLAEEARQQAEEERRAEEAQEQAEAEERLAEEARQQAEEERRAEEAQEQAEAEERLAEEARQQAEEERRAEEEQQQAEEEERLAEEAKQRAEEERQAEAARQEAEEEPVLLSEILPQVPPVSQQQFQRQLVDEDDDDLDDGGGGGGGAGFGLGGLFLVFALFI